MASTIATLTNNAGLYNDFNKRIRNIAPDGSGYINRAVPLEIIALK